MWNKKTAQQQDQSSADNPSPESLGFAADVEAAARGGGSGASDEPLPETEYPQPGVPGFNSFLSDEAAASLIRMMFSPLAVNDHAAWMPSGEAIGKTAPVVQRGLEELLDKLMPKLFIEYANRFPNTAAMIMSLTMLWYAQYSIVRKAKAAEAAAAENVRTIDADPVVDPARPFDA